MAPADLPPQTLRSSVDLWPIVVAAFFGAFFAFLFTRVGEWLAAKLARGKVHRNALVRLDRLTTDYLNDIITNRRLAEDSQKATASAHLYWKFPHAFEVDRSYAIEVFDIDMTMLIVGMNTNLRRYNHDVEDLRRAHNDLQRAHLDGTLPLDAWTDTMGRMAPHWGELAGFLDNVKDEVCNIKVQAYLLVRQYDSRRARWLRCLGIVSSWPLDPKVVEAERKRFDEERAKLLEESRVKQAALRARG